MSLLFSRKPWSLLSAGALIASLVLVPTAVGAEEPTNPAAARATAPLIFGWVHVGPGLPVENARVVLVTGRGKRIPVPAVVTGTRGEFSLDVSGIELPRRVVAQATGGTVHGRVFPGRMRSVLGQGPRRTMAHINPASTMAAVWQTAVPQRTRAQALHRARLVLGLEGHSLEEGIRLGITPIDARAVWRQIQRRGFDRWLRTQVRLMNSPPRPAVQVTSRQTPVTAAGIGGTAAGLVWNAVLAAAQSCDPSDSSIPGVGYLASALADTGIVTQDPSCAELQEILNDLAAIEQGISEIETALQTASNEIFEVAALIKVDALSNARSELQYNVLSPIQVGQAAYTFLTNSAQTTTTRLNMSLGDILMSTDDSIVNNADVLALRKNATSILSPAGQLGTGFATAVQSLTADGIISDTLGGVDKGVLHLTWDAVRTLSPFIDDSQLAMYNQVGAFLRQVNSHAAALSIDIARSNDLTSEQITTTIIDPWRLPDTYFDRVSTDYLPCSSVDDTYDGRCDVMTVTDGAGTVQSWSHAAPVIDPTSGLMWASVCAADGMALAACEVTGVMSYTGGDGKVTPYWFNTPVTLAWSGDGGAFTRPTSSQIASLAEVAKSNGQQSSAITGWIAGQAPAFAAIASHPIASTSIAFDCGWAAPTDFFGKPMKDEEGYFICPATEICKDGFKNPIQPDVGLVDIGPGSCYGLQGAGYTVAEDLLGGSHRIGWAIPSSSTTTTLPLASQPAAPTNILESQAVLWWWQDFVCPPNEDSPPPTSGSCFPYTMGTYTAPLVVRSIDISRYTVSSWDN